MKAVIFDIDGTLTHTKSSYILLTVRKVLENFNREDLDEKEIFKFWFHMGRNEIIKSWRIEPQDFWRIFKVHDNPCARKHFIETYEDIWVLKKLRENEIKIGALSNAPPQIVAMNLEKIPIVFDCVVNSFGTLIRRKPDPHGIEECLQLMDVKKDDALMVGNGIEDHLAAKAAGIKDVFIDRKEHDIEIPATIKIKSLEELLNLI